MSDRPNIMLYNTLTRKKEKFVPLSPNIVSFYSCGQTVYEDVHVGNAKTFIVWDMLVRILRHFGYNVKHLQNFTDVGHLTDDADQGEDKIVKRAKLLNEHPMELVDRKIYEYYLDMDAINIARPNLAPRATAHLSEMIDLVQKLLENGHAYEVDGTIYFDISTFPDYGKMARLDLENLQAGARIDVIEGKKNPGDFALWIKAPQEHIMQYSSPWGKGYPGWHLECSVMSMKYLGETIDLHAGGIDHIPVHHTNEIAQSEGATGKQFSQFWLHSAFITLNGEKMSKSTGNFYSLTDLIKEIGKGPARFALSQAHYRTQADFSVKQAKASSKRYYRLIRSYHQALTALVLEKSSKDASDENQAEKIIQQFDRALADDINTPRAYAQINTVAKRMDSARKSGDINQVQNFVNVFETMMDVLGVPIVKLTPEEIIEVDSLILTREELRKNKQLEESDQIRKFLQFKEYVLEDQVEGLPVWYKKEF
ncbi:MAG: cysteine--tRNA ligase [Candidatus Kariarchaeaceae archaeon]|jgi:cysteinyl-tRNA synthetase